jgi:hypothetical protein
MLNTYNLNAPWDLDGGPLPREGEILGRPVSYTVVSHEFASVEIITFSETIQYEIHRADMPLFAQVFGPIFGEPKSDGSPRTEMIRKPQKVYLTRDKYTGKVTSVRPVDPQRLRGLWEMVQRASGSPVAPTTV